GRFTKLVDEPGESLAELRDIYRGLIQHVFDFARNARDVVVSEKAGGAYPLVHGLTGGESIETGTECVQQLPALRVAFGQETAAQRLDFWTSQSEGFLPGSPRGFGSRAGGRPRLLSLSADRHVLAQAAGKRAGVDGLGNVSIAPGFHRLLLVTLHCKCRQ